TFSCGWAAGGSRRRRWPCWSPRGSRRRGGAPPRGVRPASPPPPPPRGAPPPRPPPAPPPRSRLAPLSRLALLLPAGGAPLLLLALYPPIDPDPGSYHLRIARGFMQNPGLPFFANLRFPVFPQLSELLFAIVLRLHGTPLAHLVEFAMALFTA